MIDYTIQFWRDDKATSDQNLNREFLRMKYHEARWKLVERNLLKTNFIAKLIYIFSKTRFLEEKELLLLRSNKRVPTIHSTKSNEIISVYKQYLISPIILCHEKKKKKKINHPDCQISHAVESSSSWKMSRPLFDVMPYPIHPWHGWEVISQIFLGRAILTDGRKTKYHAWISTACTVIPETCVG